MKWHEHTYWTQGQINPPNPIFELFVGGYTKTVVNPRIILYRAKLRVLDGPQPLVKLMRPVYGVRFGRNVRLKEQEGLWYTFPGTYTAGEQTGFYPMDDGVPKWAPVKICSVELYGDLAVLQDGYITAESNETGGPATWYGIKFGNQVFAAEPIEPPWGTEPPK